MIELKGYFGDFNELYQEDKEMRIATQSDFYFQTYGPEEGVKRLEKQGYQYVVYTITGRYDQPFTTQWTDVELEEHYAPVKTAIANSTLEMLFAIVGTDIYNDVLHHTFEARKKMCVHAVKAAAFAGCKILAVRPATIVRGTQDAMEKSKAISLEVFDAMKEEADKLGVKLAFVNNTMSQTLWGGNFCYGSTTTDLLELAEKYDAGIVLDPVNANLAMQRVEDLLIGVGDKLIGFLLTDIEGTTRTSVLPTMGIINYTEIPNCLKKAPEEAALVVMQTPVLKRYSDFINHEPLVEAVSRFLRKTADVILQKSFSKEV